MKVHSVYADGTIVYDKQEPPKIAGPDPATLGTAHTVLRWDFVNGRVYQGREYGAGNVPVLDIDFTNPTHPDGRVLPGHPGPPRQHCWVAMIPGNPKAGFKRGAAEAIP